MPTTTNDKFDKSFLDADINQLVKSLTMDEKVSLLAGSGWWETVSVPRKNIPR
jgi:beta-glucosidase